MMKTEKPQGEGVPAGGASLLTDWLETAFTATDLMVALEPGQGRAVSENRKDRQQDFEQRRLA